MAAADAAANSVRAFSCALPNTPSSSLASPISLMIDSLSCMSCREVSSLDCKGGAVLGTFLVGLAGSLELFLGVSGGVKMQTPSLWFETKPYPKSPAERNVSEESARDFCKVRFSFRSSVTSIFFFAFALEVAVNFWSSSSHATSKREPWGSSDSDSSVHPLGLLSHSRAGLLAHSCRRSSSGRSSRHHEAVLREAGYLDHCSPACSCAVRRKRSREKDQGLPSVLAL